MRKNNQKILENLIENIRREISSLEELNLSIGPLVEKVEVADKEEKILYNRAAGSILHDFYTGIEKIFCDIANKIDKGLPRQKDWHIRLLKSMAETKKNRPEVISLELMEKLKEYLGFRHLFRNIYGMQLDWDKLKILLIRIQGDLWLELKEQFDLFIKKIRDDKRNEPAKK